MLATCPRLEIMLPQPRYRAQWLWEMVVLFLIPVHWLRTCLQNHVVFCYLWSGSCLQRLGKAKSLWLVKRWTRVHFESFASYVVATHDCVNNPRFCPQWLWQMITTVLTMRVLAVRILQKIRACWSQSQFDGFGTKAHTTCRDEEKCLEHPNFGPMNIEKFGWKFREFLSAGFASLRS